MYQIIVIFIFTNIPLVMYRSVMFIAILSCLSIPLAGQSVLLRKNLSELRQDIQQKQPSVQPLSRFQSLQLQLLSSGPDMMVSGAHSALAAAPIPAAWRYHDLATFCKLEVQMEKTLKIPVKFRLGEVQQVERKEGKLKVHGN